jgi:uncharacterized protein DUF1016/nuclease YhcG-like protein
VAQTANAALTTLHWQIGARGRQDVLRERRAKYGAEIVAALGRRLEARFGRGFGEKSLRRMVQFAEAFPDPEIVAALRRQLSWAHFELKIGDFKPADAGQVELYLRWLDRHDRQPGEETPMAIILCAGKKRETVEYLDLGRSGIHVAEYLTELPPREVLRQRFQAALAAARALVERREAVDSAPTR